MTSPSNIRKRLTAANRILSLRRGEVRRVSAIDRHRNGVAGEPFHVVLFQEAGRNAAPKLAVVFDEPHHVAVLDVTELASRQIAFGRNSWRGDWFEPDLRAAITAFDAPESTDNLTHSKKGQT
jgi:hypothetical protein